MTRRSRRRSIRLLPGSAPQAGARPDGLPPGAASETHPSHEATHTHRRHEPAVSPTARRGTDFLAREATLVGRLLVLAVGAAALGWALLRVQTLTAAVVIAFAEVSMLWPVVRRLRRAGIPGVIAALACVLAFSAAFLALFAFVVLRIIASWPELAASVTEAVTGLQAWLETQPLGVDGATLQAWAGQVEASLGGVLARVGALTAAGVSAVGTLVTVLLVATFLSIFVLGSGERLWDSFAAVLPQHRRPAADAALRASMSTAGSWFYASTLTGLIDGTFIGLGLYLLDVPLALALGAVTFLLGYVPLVGATLAGALAIVVAFVTGGVQTALWALLIVLLVQQLEGNVLSPLLLSKAVSFHPAVTLILTTGASLAFGLVGLFLAVPVAGIVVAAVGAWRRSTAATRT